MAFNELNANGLPLAMINWEKDIFWINVTWGDLNKTISVLALYLVPDSLEGNAAATVPGGVVGALKFRTPVYTPKMLAPCKTGPVRTKTSDLGDGLGGPGATKQPPTSLFTVQNRYKSTNGSRIARKRGSGENLTILAVGITLFGHLGHVRDGQKRVQICLDKNRPI
ncbi:hypothetical protein DFH07DRAFT_776097 [Mycena maculata]|uniref:Uncharacterized protein n=1 Tax=Mycena maculata TaxID=230809 RepID=A0AAD7IR19_9AGAR|nr:hypothetical protein DFH07DRAFT_776097 [Mycena maculata]